MEKTAEDMMKDTVEEIAENTAEDTVEAKDGANGV